MLLDYIGTDKFSIAVMGPGSVGKSALTLSYTQNMFVADYDPTSNVKPISKNLF